MNYITKKILGLILVNQEAWEKKTGELRYKWVMEQLSVGREAFFFKEIYWPRYKKLAMCYENNIMKDCEWGDVEVDFGTIIVRSPVEYEHLDWFEERLRPFWELVWDSEDWTYEEPSQEEMLGLGIRCETIAIQERMF